MIIWWYPKCWALERITKQSSHTVFRLSTLVAPSTALCTEVLKTQHRAPHRAPEFYRLSTGTPRCGASRNTAPISGLVKGIKCFE